MSEVKVLFVCTGNICRSPTAEGVLRHKLAEAGLGGRVSVDSAGTIGYHAGEPPDRRAIQRAARRGYDLQDQRARQLRREDFETFDLVLCMDRGHFRQLGRLCPPHLAERVKLFLEYAGVAGLPAEVPDPYYGRHADYDYALDLIEPGVEGLIVAIERDFL
ncbi:MAG: low molecular weight phosphotyrosine protein phosphatase [Rhodospirillales bacterium]|nr:low molecular weight phosphotyrosine protein phosphatase [Rhodospirillales bacterium]MDH3911168.1 low molecular weight phosphotyrosine protein phosphatase [Rhodospirillales bacterium]